MGILKGGEPIFIKRSGEIICLLYHGWTSTPHEVRELSHYLASKGLSVKAPLLVGHGLAPQALKDVTYNDWLNQARREYKELRAHYKDIIIGGSSLGGNLALMLAAETKPKAVLSLGASIYIRNIRIIKRVLPVVAKFKKTFHKHYPKSVNMSLINKKVHYWHYPSESLVEVVRSMDATNNILSSVDSPTLVMQSATDHILPRANAEDIYYRIVSPIKRLIFVPDSYHVFTIDNWRGWAFDEIYKFIKQVIKK